MNPLTNPTPNYNRGRYGRHPIAIVIHCISGSLQAADAWFADPYSQVSAHYAIGKSGETHQYVHESDTAWHAGIVNTPSWKLYDPKTNPNLVTIGIEHEGQFEDVWPDIQKKTSAQLIANIARRWNISLDRLHVIGHYELDSVNRANCPADDKDIIDTLIALAKTL